MKTGASREAFLSARAESKPRAWERTHYQASEMRKSFEAG